MEWQYCCYPYIRQYITKSHYYQLVKIQITLRLSSNVNIYNRRYLVLNYEVVTLQTCIVYAVGKVAAGKVAVGKVAAGKVAVGKVAAGKVAAGKVAAGKVAVGKVAAGKVAAGKVAAGKVAVGKVAAGKVAAGKVAAGKVDRMSFVTKIRDISSYKQCKLMQLEMYALQIVSQLRKVTVQTWREVVGTRTPSLQAIEYTV